MIARYLILKSFWNFHSGRIARGLLYFKLVRFIVKKPKLCFSYQDVDYGFIFDKENKYGFVYCDMGYGRIVHMVDFIK